MMTRSRLLPMLANERGIALVMSLIALLVLSALVLAFSTMSSTEPTIANNQARVAQARAIAEAGIERAIWELNAGTAIAAPFDGSIAMPIPVNGTKRGEFTVAMTPGNFGNIKYVDIRSVGWVPDRSSDWNAHQIITTTVMRFGNTAAPGTAGGGGGGGGGGLSTGARCALCVRGSLQVWGSSVVDATGAADDPACGPPNLRSRPGTIATGGVNTGGAGKVYGSNQPLSGNNEANRVSNNLDDVGGPYDIIAPVAPGDLEFEALFDAFKFKDMDLNALKDIAKANGTYYQGSVTFNSSNKLPSGIVFIDTVSGQNITPTTPTSDFANVDIHGNPGSDANNTFNGWIIVNGSLQMSGNMTLNGLVYATNDIGYQGTGDGGIHGQMISANVRDTVATQVYDSTTTGNSLIKMNCAYVRDGGAPGSGPGGTTVPDVTPNTAASESSWIQMPGSYKERAD